MPPTASAESLRLAGFDVTEAEGGDHPQGAPADPAGTEAMFVDTDGAGADAGFGTALEGLAKRLSGQDVILA